MISRIHSILSKATDRTVNSPQLSAAVVDWTTFHHLSPQRSVFVRSIRHLIRGRVLEIGAECGAITRFLGETGADVLALEADVDAAAVARLRCSDLPNVEVAEHSLDDLDARARFDTIFVQGAAADVVDRARRLLKPGGCLILVVANQVWRAITREWVEPDAPLGPRGVADWLRARGFKSCETAYLFPDYHAPSTILTDAALAADEFDAAGLFDTRTLRFRRPDYVEPPLDWKALRRAGLLGDFAPGLLVVARRTGSREKAFTSWAYLYSAGRTAAFSKETIIEKSGGQLWVRRRALSDATPAPDALSRSSLKDEPWIGGEPYDRGLHRIVHQEGWTAQQIAEWAEPWVKFLRVSQLPEDYLDCTPFNLVIDEAGALVPFDLEYAAQVPLQLDWVVFRGLWGALVRQRGCAEAGRQTSLNVTKLAAEVMGTLGVETSPERVRQLIACEARFQNEVTATPVNHAMFTLRRQMLDAPENPEDAPENGFLLQLFFSRTGEDFSEDLSVREVFEVSTERRTLELLVPPMATPPGALRFDMANRPGVLQVHALKFVDLEDREIWNLAEWPPALAIQNARDVVVACEAESAAPVTFTMQGNDPSVELGTGSNVRELLARGGALVVECTWLEVG